MIKRPHKRCATAANFTSLTGINMDVQTLAGKGLSHKCFSSTDKRKRKILPEELVRHTQPSVVTSEVESLGSASLRHERHI